MGSLILALVACLLLAATIDAESEFDKNYGVTWGGDHVWNRGFEVQLTMNGYSGGSGFESKQAFGSGFFHTRIKLPNRNSAGVVTAFYLTSKGNKQDEIDFEFLGNKEGKPYTLQTNVFTNGHGAREQRLILWFDPTADYHTYQILWNQHQIVFFVDNIPIRVHKNNPNIIGGYPTHPMHIEASLWDGDSWATDGGQTKIDWNYAPFRAYFQGFDISACPTNPHHNDPQCFSSQYWWNSRENWSLNSDQQRQYDNVKRKYINYDYCLDRHRYHVPPPECFYQ